MTMLELKRQLADMPRHAILVFRCASAANRQFIFYRWKWRGEKLMTMELNWIDEEEVDGFDAWNVTVQEVLNSNLPDETEFELSGTGTSGGKPTALRRAVLIDID
jgi:hypothetical protein